MVNKTRKRVPRGKERKDNDRSSPDSPLNETETENDVRIQSRVQNVDTLKGQLEGLKKKEAMISQLKLGLNNMDNVLTNLTNVASSTNSQGLPSMDTLQKFDELLMKKIELVLDTLRSAHALRSRSKSVILEIFRSGTITPEQVDRLDSYCISLLVSRLQILRVERKGTKHQVVLNDFSS